MKRGTTLEQGLGAELDPALSSALGRMRPGHELTLLEGGKEFFPALAEAMDAASQSIHLETYIFEFSGMALLVADALVRAARRGLDVRLVIDGVGSPDIPEDWRRVMEDSGLQLVQYAPLGRLGLLIPSRWRRLHRKLCVVDGRVGFCGGINIIDDRDDVAIGPLAEPRLDYSIRVLGPLVADMADTMEQLWWRIQVISRIRQREFKQAWGAMRETNAGEEIARFIPHWDQKFDASNGWKGSSGSRSGRRLRSGSRSPDGVEPSWTSSLAAELRPVDDANAALLLRDNVSHRADIERAYLKAIGEARSSIILANAYFIPGRRIRKALLVAKARGVRVRVLLQGRYENFLQYHAARPVYQQLVLGGIELYEYGPSSLHAKVAVVDQRWATVGSTNLDPLSLLLAREANVMTSDARFARLLHASLEREIGRSGAALDTAKLTARPVRQRLLDRLAFGVMRVILFVTGHRY